MKSGTLLLFGTTVGVALSLLLAGCDNPTSGGSDDSTDTSDEATVELRLRASSAVEGTDEASTASAVSIQNTGETATCEDGGYIISGAPEYMKVTLTRVSLRYSEPSGSHTVWSGSHELKLEGTSLDLDELSAEFSKIPPGTVSGVNLSFAGEARIKGEVSGCMRVYGEGNDWSFEHVTAYTDPEYVYDAGEETGGAESYAAFGAEPAQETTVHISDRDSFQITYDRDIEVAEDSDRLTLTLFFDLNRVLRFFNGEKYDCEAPDPDSEEYDEGGDWDHGVNPGDPSDKAYFFAHSHFPIVVFAGEEGRIEGYETEYNVHDTIVPGWMSLVFDPDDRFIGGELIGDDDNDLTVAKGTIQEFSDNGDGTYDLFYDLDHGESRFYVDDFERQNTVGDRHIGTDNFWTDHEYGDNSTGSASFTLRLVR